MDGEAWGDEEDGIDIDMGDDILAGQKNEPTGDPLIDGNDVESDIFVPPSAGADPMSQILKSNP